MTDNKELKGEIARLMELFDNAFINKNYELIMFQKQIYTSCLVM